MPVFNGLIILFVFLLQGVKMERCQSDCLQNGHVSYYAQLRMHWQYKYGVVEFSGCDSELDQTRDIPSQLSE